jgi:hypothetical protein
MVFQKFSISVFSLLFLIACNSLNPADSDISSDTLDVVLIDTSVFVLDKTISILPDSLVKSGYVEETKILATAIEVKFGVQWDFCDCIVKSDSINKIMSDLEGVSEAHIDVVFARWNEIDKHCKALITAPNTTPDERNEYSLKVKQCLKKAGIK